MANLNKPGISISYVETIKNFVPQMQNGSMCLLMIGSKDGVYVLPGDTLPEGLDERAVEYARSGGAKKIIVIVSSDAESNTYFLAEAAKYNFDVVAGDYLVKDTAVKAVVDAQLLQERPCMGVVDGNSTITNSSSIVKLYAPSDSITLKGGTQVGTNVYTSKIGGLIAGMGTNGSLTMLPLSDIEKVPAQSTEEINAKIAAGYLVFFQDEDVVRIARGINTLTNQTSGDCKIRTMVIKNRLSKAIKAALKGYVGQVVGSYDNKMLILGQLKLVLRDLANESMIESDYVCDMDVEAIADYIGKDAEGLSIEELRRANTGDKMFVVISIRLLDVIEEIIIKIQA